MGRLLQPHDRLTDPNWLTFLLYCRSRLTTWALRQAPETTVVLYGPVELIFTGSSSDSDSTWLKLHLLVSLHSLPARRHGGHHPWRKANVAAIGRLRRHCCRPILGGLRSAQVTTTTCAELGIAHHRFISLDDWATGKQLHVNRGTIGWNKRAGVTRPTESQPAVW